MTETLINLSTTTKPVASLTFTGATTNDGITTTSVFAVSATAIPEPNAPFLIVAGAVLASLASRLSTSSGVKERKANA